MQIKKTITAIVVIIVIIGLIASYVFTGFTPPPTQPTVMSQPQSPAERAGTPPLPFTGPSGDPYVNGPSGPPGSQ